MSADEASREMIELIRQRALAATSQFREARGTVGSPRSIMHGSPEAMEDFHRYARDDILFLIAELDRLYRREGGQREE